jgi:predicted nuclease of predicted toxin-antitoxin system
MKILIDMNLSPRCVDLFSNAGIEAVHWSVVGKNSAPDAEIMAYAGANGYVVLTHDLDFGTILAATRGEKPSVVQIRADDASPDAIGKQTLFGLRQVENELESVALVTIDPPRTRLRVLPLRLKKPASEDAAE